MKRLMGHWTVVLFFVRCFLGIAYVFIASHLNRHINTFKAVVEMMRDNDGQHRPAFIHFRPKEIASAFLVFFFDRFFFVFVVVEKANK